VSTEARFESTGPVAFLTFDRPQARNALTWAMYDALVAACDRVDADDTVRVFVVRAEGEAFAAGTDIRQFTSFASGDEGLAYERKLDAVIDRLERVAVPTIAQVHGVAAGAGCAIALTCDFRVCTPAAQFGVPIARTLGNCLSAANVARIADLIGPARTKDLLFTGRLIDVAEATSLGTFAFILSTRLGRRVEDRTGLHGTFAIDLEYAPLQTPPADATQAPVNPDRPSLFTAIQEQLGLKLDATQGPVDVLVIDHIERPSPN